ncbi:hypothetical protein AMK16_02310 [Streptomyces sp. CB00455]|uniref:hypothetical protein n=1 Tax=Streptomyces sp. CB00455 TaxID=1703927 RepID=UPI00093A226A|nr:hypothetical protein [Streptomyces sp. CB00455]OKK22072.1 hypothetical protein AMK16_02310 [Streptomyces sp. CB00455]
MSTGITVEDSCVSAFQELRSKRNVNTVIYKLGEGPDRVVLDYKGNLTHEELLRSLPAAEPRFVVYDLAFATPDGARWNKTMMISWLPEGADARQQAAHEEAEGILRDLLDGIHLWVRATRPTDLGYDALVAGTS